ncbi:MAG: hypothetical protein AAF800_10515 [Planctomycetota bacterium]
MALSENASSRPRHGRRRLLYTTNVVAAAAVALAAVVVVNLLVDRQVRRLPAGVQDWVRLDLSAGRANTLSPQTRQVLDGFDAPLRLVALLRVEDKHAQDLADLLAAYQRASVNVAVRSIDPGREPGRVETFFRELETRFDNETDALRSAVNDTLDTTRRLTATLDDVRTQVRAAAAGDGLTDGDVRAELNLLGNQLEQVARTYRDAAAQIGAAVAEPLPPWASAKRDLLGALRRADAEVLQPFAARMRRRAEDRAAPLAVRDAMLRLGRELEALRPTVREAVETLDAAPGSVAYDRLLASLRAGEGVVLLTEERLRFVALAGMVVPGEPDAEGRPTTRFIGEDRLTGALATLGRATPPRAVWVHDRPAEITDPRAGYSHAAGRLTLADFDVQEWRLGGDHSEPAPPPAALDQDTVWVVTGLSLRGTSADERRRVADVIGDGLEAGDGALLCFNYDPDALVREADPLAELAGAWGLVPREHELVLRESLGPDGRPRGEAGWVLDAPAAGSPIEHALAGLAVHMVAPTPLRLEPRPGVAATPWLTLDDRRGWVADGLTTPEQIAAARYDAGADAAGVAVAAGSRRVAEGSDEAEAIAADPGRLAVFTERHWLGDRQAPRRLGNSELLLNTVYWLADLDSAIAATPRSAALRRVGPMGDGEALAYRLSLLAGLPAAALLAGAVVWWVRRRG